MLFSGYDLADSHKNGVACLLSKKALGSLLEWKPINERLMWCRFHSRARNITIIQAYAPTELADRDVKELFYDQLASTINSSHKKDNLILMGDLNAKVGADNRNVEHVMGKWSIGSRNENGETRETN